MGFVCRFLHKVLGFVCLQGDVLLCRLFAPVFKQQKDLRSSKNGNHDIEPEVVASYFLQISVFCCSRCLENHKDKEAP